MTDFTFISGNLNKVKQLEWWLGRKVDHIKLDLAEIQSLDLQEVVEHKVKEAYRLINKPVLVEDIALSFDVLGRLPGTLVKWFLEELGNEGLCRLLDGYTDRSATVHVMYGLYDGTDIRYFEGATRGSIARKPSGSHGQPFGWNPLFIPQGLDKTYAEIPDKEMGDYHHRAQAVKKLKQYLAAR